MFVRAVFYRGPSAWSRLIEWRSHGPYSHVELWLDGPANKAFTFSSLEPKGARFTGTPKADFIDLTNGHWDVIEISEDSASGVSVYREALKRDGMPYDWLGLLNFSFTGRLMHLGVHDSKDRFCSEVCSELLHVVGLMKLEQPSYKVTPVELAGLLAEQYGKPRLITP